MATPAACWRADEFVASLAALSDPAREAYARDVHQFLAWAGRGGCPEPAQLDRRALRRYLPTSTRVVSWRARLPARPPPSVRISAISAGTA